MRILSIDAEQKLFSLVMRGSVQLFYGGLLRETWVQPLDALAAKRA